MEVDCNWCIRFELHSKRSKRRMNKQWPFCQWVINMIPDIHFHQRKHSAKMQNMDQSITNTFDLFFLTLRWKQVINRYNLPPWLVKQLKSSTYRNGQKTSKIQMCSNYVSPRDRASCRRWCKLESRGRQEGGALSSTTGSSEAAFYTHWVSPLKHVISHMIPDEKRVRKHESRRAVPPSPETGSYSAVFYTHWAYHHSFLRRDWEKGTMVIFMTKSMMLMLKTMAFDILGLRYWAHYLLKPDRSNSLSCNKIQFRFWSIRQCPIPSHLISLKKFGNSLTRSLFGERPPDIEAWENISDYWPFFEGCFALLLSWNNIWVVGIQSPGLRRCHVRLQMSRKSPVCAGWHGGGGDLGWLYKVFYGRPALNLPNCHLVAEEARWWPRSDAQSS